MVTLGPNALPGISRCRPVISLILEVCYYGSMPSSFEAVDHSWGWNSQFEDSVLEGFRFGCFAQLCSLKLPVASQKSCSNVYGHVLYSF